MIVYGHREYGSTFVKMLSATDAYNDDNIIYVDDKEKDNDSAVLDLKGRLINKPDETIIIAEPMEGLPSAIKYLNSMGAHNYISSIEIIDSYRPNNQRRIKSDAYNDEWRNNFLRDFRKRVPLLFPNVVISVGQACSLRCKNCGNLSPYSVKENMRYPIEELIDEAEAFLNAVDYVFYLQIQGGGAIDIFKNCRSNRMLGKK